MRMIPIGLAQALALSYLALPHAAISAEKHVHGEAELFVVLEGKQALVEIESPADNVLGFEHQPRTKAQKNKASKALETLKNPDSLFSLLDSNCTLSKSDIKSPFTKDHDHDKHHSHHKEHKHDHHKEHEHDDEHHSAHQHDHHDHDDEHSSFHISYEFTCENTADINGIKVTAFETFNGFETIDVNWVKGEQQGAKELSKDNQVVNF